MGVEAVVVEARSAAARSAAARSAWIWPMPADASVRPARARPIVVVLGLALLATACSAASAPPAASRATPLASTPAPAASAGPTPSVVPTPATSPSRAAGPPPLRPLPRGVHPFTGQRAAGGPVLAVKIDNTRAARPQTGVWNADLVYVEEVEAGLTRLLAVYSSRPPRVVGPVRSARISDLELLAQFGRVALAYSGAQRRMLPLIARAPLYDVGAQRHFAGYYRSRGRSAPYNLYGQTHVLFDRAPAAARARDIGLRFGAPTVPAARAGGAEATWQRARMSWTWSPAQQRWLVRLDGRPDVDVDGRWLGPANVVVQYVEVQPSRFRDVNGAVTPHSVTVGRGLGIVYRDGTATPVTWVRDAPGRGTRLLAKGRDVTLTPGQTWVVLLDSRRAVRRF